MGVITDLKIKIGTVQQTVWLGESCLPKVHGLHHSSTIGNGDLPFFDATTTSIPGKRDGLVHMGGSEGCPIILSLSLSLSYH